MARLHPTTLTLPPIDFRNWNVDTDPHELAMRALQEKSDALTGDQVVDAIVRFPVADGHATYLVTKESPLTLQHVDYMDAWDASPALIRGLRKQDIIDQLERGRRMKALWEKQAAARAAQ